jgi:hypothetical protein
MASDAASGPTFNAYTSFVVSFKYDMATNSNGGDQWTFFMGPGGGIKYETPGARPYVNFKDYTSGGKVLISFARTPHEGKTYTHSKTDGDYNGEVFVSYDACGETLKWGANTLNNGAELWTSGRKGQAYGAALPYTLASVVGNTVQLGFWHWGGAALG